VLAQSDLARAQEMMESNAVAGKIALIPG